MSCAISDEHDEEIVLPELTEEQIRRNEEIAALQKVPHSMISIHPLARVYHSFREMKALGPVFDPPEAQASFPGGECVRYVDYESGYWIHYDCNRKISEDNEYLLLATAFPPYAQLLNKALEDEECSGSTSGYVPPHVFEPVANAQEIRESLPKDASVKEAVDTILRTCKGCAEMYSKEP